MHHFVPPSRVLRSDDRSHFIKQIQVVLFNFSCPFLTDLHLFRLDDQMRKVCLVVACDLRLRL